MSGQARPVVLLRPVPGTSVIHRLWAGTKILAVFGFSLLLSFYPGWFVIGLTGLLVLVAARLAHISRGALPSIPRWLWALLVLGALTAALGRGEPVLRLWSIDFEVGEQTFADLSIGAQCIFDERLTLANVPVERILELAADLSSARRISTGGVMLSFIDINLPPLGAHIALHRHRTNCRIYINQGAAAQVALWFFRTESGLSLTAAYPANVTARASLRAYIDALTTECQRAIVAPKRTPTRLMSSL